MTHMRAAATSFAHSHGVSVLTCLGNGVRAQANPCSQHPLSERSCSLFSSTTYHSSGVSQRGKGGLRTRVHALPSSERPPRGGKSGPRVEDDPGYNRVDDSELHAYQARQVSIRTLPIEVVHIPALGV